MRARVIDSAFRRLTCGVSNPTPSQPNPPASAEGCERSRVFVDALLVLLRSPLQNIVFSESDWLSPFCMKALTMNVKSFKICLEIQ